MKKQCRLILIRHGETDWNVQRRYQGWTDIPLNANGKEQVKLLACQLQDRPIRAIYSSPLQRAKQTAEIIKEMHPLDIVEFDHLKEGGYGRLEGSTFHEVKEKFADHLAIAENLNYDDRLKFRIVEGQESLEEIALRATSCLMQIAQQHLGEEVIVVTHGGVIRSMIVYHLKKDFASIDIKNAQAIPFLSDGLRFFTE